MFFLINLYFGFLNFKLALHSFDLLVNVCALPGVCEVLLDFCFITVNSAFLPGVCEVLLDFCFIIVNFAGARAFGIKKELRVYLLLKRKVEGIFAIEKES